MGSTWAPADCATARQIWNQDVTATVSQTGIYQLTLSRSGGIDNLTIDRAWLEQNGATIAAEVRDETLTATATTQSWTLTVNEITASPVTLRIATGSSAAAGSSGTITLARTGALPQPASNPVSWETWAAANNANPSDIFEFLQGTPADTNPLGIISGNQLHFRFATNRTGVALGLESSTNLTNWQPDTTATFQGEVALTPTESQRIWLLPNTDSRRFYRLKATPSAP